MSSGLSNDTSVATSSTTENGVSAVLIITFEVSFSVAIFMIITACYFIGRHRRKRQNMARLQEHDTMMERALARQQLHSINPSSCSTIETYHNHPPPYLPPPTDPTSQLSERDVAQLSQAMLNHHLRSHMFSSSPPPPPHYTDLMGKENTFNEQFVSSSSSSNVVQSVPPAVTRSLTHSFPSSANETISTPPS
ncbi:uncharacterized protein BX664DRAFT_326257 [Halteromyces radiatus]|uniref:uncharacterized protein n=1 Tax=Halteromyces radiatus TaxID=101107 RepID=UPI00221EF6F8|nr:uncharacterized protein BX664DRAFT_326257 [Halteromyces radiatus]KAI8097387.1 hypothetical protein BX664DRAFT_326257 [Halteromyces radiatus]